MLQSDYGSDDNSESEQESSIRLTGDQEPLQAQIQAQLGDKLRSDKDSQDHDGETS